MNAEWHRAHVMPKNATQEQRVAWHREHAKHCACRPIPPKLAREMREAERARTPRARAGAVDATERRR